MFLKFCLINNVGLPIMDAKTSNGIKQCMHKGENGLPWQQNKSDFSQFD